jgi:hypothetical protein
MTYSPNTDGFTLPGPDGKAWLGFFKMKITAIQLPGVTSGAGLSLSGDPRIVLPCRTQGIEYCE